MEKEKIRDIVASELMINHLQRTFPETMAKLEDSLVEALHQALSMSGVSHRFSDVDIEDEANERMFIAEDDLTQSKIYREGFVDGAIWIRDTLK